MQPKISVIMSLFNTPELWLRQALDSIINQTYNNFEFIIFIDCPTDGSDEIVKSYAKKDNRIKLVINETNCGLTANLYKAVLMSKGEYIARMDSDDIACLNRFEKQVEFLDKHKEVAVVGSLINSFSSNGNFIGMNNLGDNTEVTRIRMLFSNAGVAHPSAMIRKSFLIENCINYNLKYKKSQDYGLWVDIVNCGGKIDLLPEILLDYRIHDNQISKKNNNEQNDCAKSIIKEQLKQLIPDLTEEEFKIHLALNGYNGETSKKEYTSYINKLLISNNHNLVYNKKEFKSEILAIWQKIVLKACASGNISFLFNILFFKTLSPTVIIRNALKLRKRKQSKKILNKYLRNKAVIENE